MKEELVEMVAGVPPEIATMLLAMTPIGEVRLSIPVALTVYEMGIGSAIIFSIIGNVLAGGLALFFMHYMLGWFLEHWALFRRLWMHYVGRLQQKHHKSFEQWGALALVIFVAIPLPMTGIFSGAIASVLFNIPPQRAMQYLACGSLIASVLVTALTLSVVAVV